MVMSQSIAKGAPKRGNFGVAISSLIKPRNAQLESQAATYLDTVSFGIGTLWMLRQSPPDCPLSQDLLGRLGRLLL